MPIARATALAVLVSVCAALPVSAQEDTASSAAQPSKRGAKKEDDTGRTSDVVGYKFPRGLYTQSDLGLFWRYLGFADVTGARNVYRAKYPQYMVSNGQPFIGISLGYDFLPTVFDYFPQVKVPDLVTRFGVSGQLTLGTGYVSGAAPYSFARSKAELKDREDPKQIRAEESPKDYAMLMVHPALVFSVVPPPFERLALETRVFTGAAAMTPSAQRFRVTDPKWWLATFGGNVGVGFSIKYMTLLTNFVVGMDLAFYSLVSPGWGTELYMPNPLAGQYIWNEIPPTQSGIAAPPFFMMDKGWPVFVGPLVLANSFTPIVIKYVF